MHRTPKTLAVLALSSGILASRPVAQRSLSGRIDTERGPIVVRLYRLEGQGMLLKKSRVLSESQAFHTLRVDPPGPYRFEGLPPGRYSVVAFADLDADGQVGFDPPEPLGWFASEPGGAAAAIDLTVSDLRGADFKLRRPTAFPTEEKTTAHGALRRIRGLPLLHLWGDARERGFAHGFLVGRQIIDVFEFYLVEDSWRSARRYQEIFVPFLESHFNYPAELLEEADAVIKGMKASGVDMKVESLGREFNRTDLLAINAYIERRAAFPVAPRSSCTQFAFWGPSTRGSELDGGLIAARNMDGECDLRKVTVSHFLLFAVEPSEPGRRRWFSAMWPGFLGTLSGINADGLYSMENAGGTQPGPVVGGNVPCSWVQRQVLESLGADATPEAVLKAMQGFRNEAGGITSPGSVILWAVPFRGQPAPAFVWEGDRFGGVMRGPTQVPPTDPTNIMASNHHLVYGYDPSQPGFSFGRPVSFSSRWRYEAGSNTLQAWSRMGQALGVDHAKRLLQSVSHGTTEYSVIFLANERRILVAVDDLEPNLWDAPYQLWRELSFDELFGR